MSGNPDGGGEQPYIRLHDFTNSREGDLCDLCGGLRKAHVSATPSPQPAAEELLPCPFCEDTLLFNTPSRCESGVYFVMIAECGGCPATMKAVLPMSEFRNISFEEATLRLKAKITKKWNRRANRRPSPVEGAERIAQIEAELAERHKIAVRYETLYKETRDELAAVNQAAERMANEADAEVKTLKAVIANARGWIMANTCMPAHDILETLNHYLGDRPE